MYSMIYKFLQKQVYPTQHFNFKLLLNIQYFSILLYNNLLYYVGSSSLKLKEIKTSQISFLYIVFFVIVFIIQSIFMRVIYIIYVYILFLFVSFLSKFTSLWYYSMSNIANIFSIVNFFFISGILLAIFLFFFTSTRVNKLFGVLVSLVFPILIIFFFFFKNIFILLFIYECFIFPSILLVWFFSPNRRFTLANIYFIM